MKYAFKIILLFLLVLTVRSMAQTSAEIMNFWDNSYLVNPAAFNPKFKSEILVSHRSQWVGMPGAPQTNYVSATLSSENLKSQVGVKLISDRIGYYALNDYDLAYSYFIRFKHSQLNFGISGTFTSLQHDISKIYSEEMNDPVIAMNIQNKYSFDTNIGMEYISGNVRTGFSSNRFLELFTQDRERNIRNNTNYLYALYRGQSTGLINFGYGMALINNSVMTVADINVSTFIRMYSDAEPIQLGVSYRTTNQLGFQSGIYIGKNFKVLYSYEIDNSKIGMRTGGNHELMLRFRFERNRQWGYRHYYENLLFSY